MEAKDVVTLIGIGLTFLVSVVTLVYTVIRNKRSDYISKVTDYRLKWIDLVRKPISEYLVSLERISRGKDANIDADFDYFLEKHWQMQSFLTTFSPKDKAPQDQLNKLYESVSMLTVSQSDNRNAIREEIREELPKTDVVLRRLMDENWFGVKKEVK